MTPREKTENRKKWTEWIYKHDSNQEENEMSANRINLKSCSKISSKRKKLDGFEELLKIYESTDENGLKFVGLRNQKNDCWLNSLVQCIYSLPLRSRLLDDIKKNTQCKVTSALINVISNMMYTTSTPLYPIDLHEAIQEQYNLVPGEQQDIHESFTLLCSNGTENMNDIIARHFQIGYQVAKTCKKCDRREYQSPETLTTIILPVLNGIHDLENTIDRNMNDHVPMHCSICGEDTEHTRSGKYLFLPETLALGFNRFKHKDGNGRKTHSKVVLPLEIKVMGNEICHYNLRACALHHGHSIYSGHYTALVFDDGKVIEIDDHVVRDLTDTNWVIKSQSTVYLAFYTKNAGTCMANFPKYSKDDEKEKRKHVKSENMDERQHETSNKPAKIERFYDVTYKYKSICSWKSFGYDLLGSDFKTLEFPMKNMTYSMKNPGWLNDNIIDAYLLLLVKASSKMGLRVHAFNSFFFSRLRKAVIDDKNEKKLHDIILKTQGMVDFEAYDYLLMPINSNNHWTAVCVDIWNKRVYYYDPMRKGNKNKTAIKMFKGFFEFFYKYRKTCHILVETKRFIIDYDVVWEEIFPSQDDACSCGVFVLMYMSYHLGLLTFIPRVDSISSIRNAMAKELYLGLKKHPMPMELDKRCISPTTYKQQVGKTVILYCSTSEIEGKKFTWTFNNLKVSNEQIYKFVLTEDKAGDYCCNVACNDGDSRTSTCHVECEAPTSSDYHVILNDLKTAIHLWNRLSR